MKILFIAGFGPIVREATQSRKLYGETLGIGFEEETDGYLHTEALKGAKTFALWPLWQAAQSCFGKDSWPDDVPPPQAWLEFDVDNVEEATLELESRGISNARQEQGRTVGSDCQPFLGTRGVIGRDHLYSSDARRKITSSLPRMRPTGHPTSQNNSVLVETKLRLTDLLRAVRPVAQLPRR